MSDGITDFYRRCEWLRKHPNEPRTATERKGIIDLEKRDIEVEYQRLAKKAIDRLVEQERTAEKALGKSHEDLKDWVKESKKSDEANKETD